MYRTHTHRSLIWFATLVGWICYSSSTLLANEFAILPQQLTLRGNFQQAQLLVVSLNAHQQVDEKSEDLTRDAVFRSNAEHICQVSADGVVVGLSNGTAQVEVLYHGAMKSISVTVEGIQQAPAIEFTEDVLPVLSKAGCNAGSCHASQYGKGGFVLSVMGFDPSADQASIARDARGRRVSLLSPDSSLLLQKPTMRIPHGGGSRLDPGSQEYNLLAAWIQEGCPPPSQSAREIKKLHITPASRIGKLGMEQQLRVVAEFPDGESRDVTSLARFDSLDEAVVQVTGQGRIRAVGRGQAPVMVRYRGQAGLATMVIPLGDAVTLRDWESRNILDAHALKKFQELGIVPSGICDDATFLRRVFLDTLGGLPSMETTTAFLDSQDPNKRQRLIDQILGLTGDPQQDIYNDRYAAWWSLKWSDLLRNNSAVVGESGMWALHNWLRESFRTNKPYDQFVRELITAKGSIFSNGPANYYRIANNPPDLAESTSQLFLGTRLQCAKCHHHPYERYAQADYYGFAAFFARVGTKGSAEFGNFGGETVVVVRSTGEVSHPKTGAILKPTPLDGTTVDASLTDGGKDRRWLLADWLTHQQNEKFAQNMVNRYMAYFLGRGLVEPIDDMRSTNPPSNVGMMHELSEQFAQHQFDLKWLIKTILQSRLYQLDSHPTEHNEEDTRFYSHFRVKRIAAEALLDCIDYSTGSPTKHPNLPLGTRSIELPDANTTHPFLVTFGKPKRSTVCECERSPDENLAQALHMLNGEVLATKISDPKGRVAKLIEQKTPPDALIHELYLCTLTRRPSPGEVASARQLLDSSPSITEGAQDLLWALMNSKHFLFVR